MSPQGVCCCRYRLLLTPKSEVLVLCMESLAPLERGHLDPLHRLAVPTAVPCGLTFQGAEVRTTSRLCLRETHGSLGNAEPQV